MLSMLCYDTQQELKRVKAFGSKEFKSRQEFDAMEEKVGAFYFGAGTGTHLQLPYKMDSFDTVRNAPSDIHQNFLG